MRVSFARFFWYVWGFPSALAAAIFAPPACKIVAVRLCTDEPSILKKYLACFRVHGRVAGMICAPVNISMKSTKLVRLVAIVSDCADQLVSSRHVGRKLKHPGT